MYSVFVEMIEILKFTALKISADFTFYPIIYIQLPKKTWLRSITI